MNNCGDFTLVSRDDFFRVGGHSEEPVFSLNLDTEFLYRLVQAGLREQILDPQKEIYHIEHGTGTGATPEGMKLLLERLKSKGIPVISLEEVFARAIKMK
jgi:GT2 family glycosyltransferase